MASDYGSDIALGVGSAPRNWGLVSDALNVLNALARRYRTTRGTLFYDLEYGYALTDLVGSDLSDAQIDQAENDIAAEAEKDARILSADADVVPNSNGTFLVTVTVTLKEGTFALVLSVSALTVEVVRIDQP